MPMQEFIICPCCGRPIVLSVTENSIAVEATDKDVVKVASELGIEIGALKGGEEIGD